MTWIQTFSGKKFVFENPTLESISLEDIAHALSMQCRFNGHCKIFYSVAEHSLLVMNVVRQTPVGVHDVQLQLSALFHDAAEAYIGDMVGPIKRGLADFQRLENNLLRVIMMKFGLPYPLDPIIIAADRNMLLVEREQIMNPCDTEWDEQKAGRIWNQSQKIVGLPPHITEKEFLNEAYSLIARL